MAKKRSNKNKEEKSSGLARPEGKQEKEEAKETKKWELTGPLAVQPKDGKKEVSLS